MATSTTQYLSIVSRSGFREVAGTFDATLTDDDLIRGNDPGETVTSTDGFEIFNGYTVFTRDGRVERNGEVETTVTFSDGSTLQSVLGLRDGFTGGFQNVSLFLLDQQALADAGKTLEDVADVQITALVDHDLSWADLGFGAESVEPGPAPEPAPTPDPAPMPEPDPIPVVIEGTDGRDRLVGTSADEIFISGDNRDVMTGNGGADTFVFGADARDGGRDRDVITDFSADDTLVLELGAEVSRISERNGNTIIQLEGDRDTIVLRDYTSDSLSDQITTSDTSFLV